MKMLVTDLDGTLLRTDKTVSDYTRGVLARCKNAGIKVAYATARGKSADRLVPPELLDGRIITNGAVAKAGGDIVYSRLIPWQIARPVLTACDKRGLSMTSQIDEMHYTNFKIPDDWADIVLGWDVVDFSRHEIDAGKLYTFDLTPADVSFIKELLPENLYMVMSHDDLLMIMHKEATKSRAVAALAAHWGIAPEEIVAFGDDLNDIDLLNFAGTAVAPKNACDEAKSAADYICDTNDTDGVAKWIEENIL